MKKIPDGSVLFAKNEEMRVKKRIELKKEYAEVAAKVVEDMIDEIYNAQKENEEPTLAFSTKFYVSDSIIDYCREDTFKEGVEAIVHPWRAFAELCWNVYIDGFFDESGKYAYRLLFKANNAKGQIRFLGDVIEDSSN